MTKFRLLTQTNIPPIITKIQKRLCNVFVGDVGMRNEGGRGGGGVGGEVSFNGQEID